MKYQLPETAREYVLYQRTELLPKRKFRGIRKRLTQWGILKEDYKNFVKRIARRDAQFIDEKYFSLMKEKADDLLDFIPKSTSKILDIGCGIAGLNVFLDERLDVSSFFLLDKTRTEEKIWYMFEKQGAFYNSLDLAKETLTFNGVDPAKVCLIEAPSDGNISIEGESIDLVLSTISWGFHYPISLYIDSVLKLLSDDGVVIVDVRKGTKAEAEMREYLSVEVIGEGERIKTLKGVKYQE